VDKLSFSPCLPSEWKGFKMYYRYRETDYEIDVRRQHEGEDRAIVTVDGMELQDEAIPLVDDRRNHSVEIVLRDPPSSTRPGVEAEIR
jgi:cellobiose phosphorylase